jgi:Fe-S-cluster containining protein
MVTPFPCSKCGKCCTRITQGEWKGISLFPWETHLFPEKDIKPSLGLGTPETPDFKTILYTYTAQKCSHLEEKQCKIHTQRPLVCKSYPFRITHQGDKTIYIVAPECTQIQKWPEKKTVDVHYSEMDAAELIGDHLSRFYKASEPKWCYDTGKGWTRIGRNKTLE